VNTQLTKIVSNFGKARTVVDTNDDEPRIVVNEAIGTAAFFYEKLRNTLDYQEEHLFLKNAIKRILKRKSIINLQDKPKRLMHELVWARYFPNDTLPQSTIDDVASFLRKYDFLKNNAKSKNNPREIASIIDGFSACEIEEYLKPPEERELYLGFVRSLFIDKIQIPEDEMDPVTQRIQLDISLEKLLFKTDIEQLRFHLMRNYENHWPEITKEEADKIATNFDEILNGIDYQINLNRNSKIFKYVKRNIPPFTILWQMICENKTGAAKILGSRSSLQEFALRLINTKNKNIYKKVVKALARGIMFVLLTKIVLALIIEVPYEANLLGEINYTALIANIATPPIIMTVAGLFVRVPGPKNTGAILRMTEQIVFDNVLQVRGLNTLKKKKTRGYLLFNAVYSILSLVILALAVWLLIYFKFNFVSIILFFVFVSVVSFLAFRIRSTAKELEVRSTEEGLITGVFSFILLPFVIIGKLLSDKWSEYNFTLYFWDIIVESPFKTFISLFESWLTFVREKREDFE